MSEMELSDLERLLGHGMDPGRAGTVQDLNDIPSDLVDEARALQSRTLRYRFLQYYTSSPLWAWLPEFMDDVFERGADPRTWKRGGILFPFIPVEILVSLEVPEILSVLEPREGEAWRQIAPDRDMWNINEFVAGAPAVDRPELRYDSETSERVRRVMRNGLETLLDIDDITVATRRWIGSQIAARASKLGSVERFTDPVVLLDSIFPTLKRPSDSALISAAGILRETRVLGSDDVAVPGFRGPAEWYQS